MRLLPSLRSAPIACPWKAAAACAAVYFAGTPLSGWITAAGLPVWLAGGVALTSLMLLGLAYWPVVLVAGWLSAIATGYPPALAAPMAASGLLEALAAMEIIRFTSRRLSPSRTLPTLVSIVPIILAAPVIGATVMAGLGVGAWKTWWITDAAGLLLLAPLWTFRPRVMVAAYPAIESVAESLLSLSQALIAFETGAPVIVTTSPAVSAIPRR